jgi:periplasmic mercuric ion binding protein
MNNLIKAGIIVFLISIILNFNFASGQNKKEVVQIKTSAVCSMCKDRIEKNIAFEKGVSDIVLDVPTKIATITFNPKKTNAEKLKKAISKLGYDADDVKADEYAYNKLPSCCKKDAPKH